MSLSARPLSGPLMKHLATASSVVVSCPCTLAESKAKCALGASIPHALRIASSMLIELAVGVLGGGRGAVFTSPVLEEGVAVPVLAAVLGSGLGSEPQALARMKPDNSNAMLVHRAELVWDLMGLLLCR